ncbi:MAG: SWIM zinc finger family protein [Chloroflexi bacterium]|nr:SWIM zinc finger family protein [Chloroflexota bacterium]
MGWGSWERYERPAPRRPANGIKAQTQRGQFGKTWWAGRWIAALERLVDSARLSRGRSYARSGQVVKLDVGREGIAALVQGSRPTPYQVSIRFRRLSDAEWDKVADAMSAQALYAAKLLSGEMPAQIEEVFAAAGASLLPAASGDLQTNCSCPDWANPCKHVAAVHYLLGERFDQDPFLMFELRGRSKDEIAAMLRARRTDEVAPQLEPVAEQPAEEAEVAPALADLLDAFWSTPASAADLATTFEPPPVDALPVKRLGAPTFWRSQRDFTALMERAYQAISARALHEAMGNE